MKAVSDQEGIDLLGMKFVWKSKVANENSLVDSLGTLSEQSVIIRTKLKDGHRSARQDQVSKESHLNPRYLLSYFLCLFWIRTSCSIPHSVTWSLFVCVGISFQLPFVIQSRFAKLQSRDSNEPSEESVQYLTGMGSETKRYRQVLCLCHNDADQTVELLSRERLHTKDLQNFGKDLRERERWIKIQEILTGIWEIEKDEVNKEKFWEDSRKRERWIKIWEMLVKICKSEKDESKFRKMMRKIYKIEKDEVNFAKYLKSHGRRIKPWEMLSNIYEGEKDEVNFDEYSKDREKELKFVKRCQRSERSSKTK